jgi:signal transduction histidine kinase
MPRLRLNYFVKKNLQTKYLLFVLFAMIVPTVICGAALYYTIWQAVAKEIALPESIAESLLPALHNVNVTLLIAIPIIFTLMLILSVFTSHKIAGPIYRLEKELAEIAKGDYSRRIKLRANDDLHEIADGINKLLDGIQKK